jgi:regulator of sigma E protease
MSFRQRVYRSRADDVFAAVGAGVRETVRTLVVAVTSLGTLFKGIELRNAVAGPLRITYYVGAAASSGFSLGVTAGLVNFFRFLCFLSILLFVMNLLPVPAFDGGQILMFLAEGVSRRPLKPRLIHALQLGGFAVLLALLVMFTFSDILYFIGR